MKFNVIAFDLSRPLIVGTRSSALAQWQTNHVIAALQRAAPQLTFETRLIQTAGDKDRTRSIAELGGLGVFTKELEDALLRREIDLAVHSLKDLPTDTPAGLKIAAVVERADARDALVSRHGVGLHQLPRGARIGTASARRSAQVLAQRPDAQIVPLRGNVDTRLNKAKTDDYDAIVLAVAGIERLGRAVEITEYLDVEIMLPDPGQGALAVETRAGDDFPWLALIHHAPTFAAVTTERAFLRALGGGCRTPIAAYAEWRDGALYLRGLVAAADGSRVIRGALTGDSKRAEELGAQLANTLLQQGAADLLNRSNEISKPLAGKRILITRARNQAESFAEKIRAWGGEPIEYPTIEILPLEDPRELDNALAHVTDYDWVVFTSANGVNAVDERLRAQNSNWGCFARGHIAAIGPATARALQAHNVHVAFVPTKFRAEQIALELPLTARQRVLLLRADIASDELAHRLEACGAQVTSIHAYHTIMPIAGDLDWNTDAITFTSASTVRHFAAMVSEIPEQLAVFCIGPVTAQAAQQFGLRVAAVADVHTIDGLLQTMRDYYNKSNS